MGRLLFNIDDGLHKLFRRNGGNMAGGKVLGVSGNNIVGGKAFPDGKLDGHFMCFASRSMRTSSRSTSPRPASIPESASVCGQSFISSSISARVRWSLLSFVSGPLREPLKDDSAMSLSGVSTSGVTVRRAFPAGISGGTSKSKWRRRSAGISTICSMVMEKI